MAFVDLADSSVSGIKIPQDLSAHYFPLTYGVGARVHSDSWGSASLDYDYMASQVDLFTWENQVRTCVICDTSPWPELLLWRLSCFEAAAEDTAYIGLLLQQKFPCNTFCRHSVTEVRE